MDAFLLPGFVKTRSGSSSLLEHSGSSPKPPDGGARSSRQEANGGNSEVYSGLALPSSVSSLSPVHSDGLALPSSASTLSSVHTDSMTNFAENLSPPRFVFRMPLHDPEGNSRRGLQSLATLAEQRQCRASDDNAADPPVAPQEVAAGTPPEPGKVDAQPKATKSNEGGGESSSLMENFRPLIEIGQEVHDDENADVTLLTTSVMEGIRLFWFGGSFQCVDVIEDDADIMEDDYCISEEGDGVIEDDEDTFAINLYVDEGTSTSESRLSHDAVESNWCSLSI